MLSNIKTLLGISSSDASKDNLINVLIKHAQDEAINYCHNDNLCELESCIEEMVVYNYNRLDNKELQSENYSGVTFTYISDYPASILRQLKPHRKVRFL